MCHSSLITRALASVVLVLCLLPISAQEVGEPPDDWLTQAQTITDDLGKDAAALTRFERALLWARLSRVWWQKDRERARAWLQKAVEEVETPSDQESSAERRQRLAAVRALLSLIAQQDSNLGDRLTDGLLAQAKGVVSSDQEAVASALIDAALTTLDINPKRAVALGSAALQLSSSPRIGALLGALYKRDGKLGDELLLKALAVARATYRRDLPASLAAVAFREVGSSNELRQGLLSVLAAGLLRQPLSPNDDFSVCNLAPIAAPLLIEFQRLLPQQTLLIRTTITRCQPTLRTWDNQQVNESLDDLPLKTVDDLLRAAEKAKDTLARDSYLERAAYMASEEKNFDRAISILESISTEGRQRTEGAWESLRASWASEAAIARLKNKDYYGVKQVMDATPVNLRAFVQIDVVRELFTSGDHGNAISYLDEARKGFAKANAPNIVGGYLSLVRFYALLVPADAPRILNEAIAAINRVEKAGAQENASATGETATYSTLSNELLLRLYHIPLSLLESDPVGVRLAISSIESPVKRAAVRLNLLEAVLKKRRAVATAKRSES